MFHLEPTPLSLNKKKHSLMYQRINIITNIILLYILKVSYLTDYKSRFKSHKQFKTNLIHQNFAID